MNNIIQKLINYKRTISTMESCTGGYVANEITNIEGASEVFKFGAVTYSNEYKIKIGVPKKVIDEYTVYSIETASVMARAISNYTNSDYGIGVTGKLNKEDPFNKTDNNNIVYICIYDRVTNVYNTQTVTVENIDRKKNKEMIMKIIINMLNNIIK